MTTTNNDIVSDQRLPSFVVDTAPRYAFPSVSWDKISCPCLYLGKVSKVERVVTLCGCRQQLAGDSFVDPNRCCHQGLGQRHQVGNGFL